MVKIITEKRIININTDLLKIETKKVALKALNILTIALTLTGIFWIVGISGNSDLNLIAPHDTFVGILKGYTFCGAAWALNCIKERILKL